MHSLHVHSNQSDSCDGKQRNIQHMQDVHKSDSEGSRYVGQQRSIQQQHLFSQLMHLPQLHSSISFFGIDNSVGKHLQVQHLKINSRDKHFLQVHSQASVFCSGNCDGKKSQDTAF